MHWAGSHAVGGRTLVLSAGSKAVSGHAMAQHGKVAGVAVACNRC